MPASFAEYVAALLPPDQAREIAASLGRDVDRGLEGAVASAGVSGGADGGARAQALVERALDALEPEVLAELCALYEDVRGFEARLAESQASASATGAADEEVAAMGGAVDVGEAARGYLALVRRMEALSVRLEARVGGGPAAAEVVSADAVVPPPPSGREQRRQEQRQQPWGASFSQPRRRKAAATEGAVAAQVVVEPPTRAQQPRRKRAAPAGADPASAAR